MGVFTGLNNNADQIINISNVTLGAGQTGNSVTMYGGNDTVIGSPDNDIISGGYGNDSLSGNAGNDFLNGQEGNDTLLGGTGNDSLYGSAGNDSLNGQAGFDYLYGGAGNDTYIHNLNSGNDVINDNQTGAGGAGGGMSDVLQFSGLLLSNIIAIYQANNPNLYVTSYSDINDNGVINDGVIIQNYFQGGDFVIERIAGSDGIPYFLNSQVIPFFQI